MILPYMSSSRGSKESESAALKGIFSGGSLTVIEIIGGILSGSLGLISSALNSMMDFIAAIITFFAVRESSKPPDEVHMYGHEKVESTAAIGEIVLLFLMCLWITYSAVTRLMSGEGAIEQFWIAFGTNFLSIVLDSFAYVSLKRSVKKRPSQASEAGSLHFLNDLLIAIVVIVGLGFYRFGAWYADSLAAIGIVAFTSYTSAKMVKGSFSDILDAAPPNVVHELRSHILRVPGVRDVHSIRIRRAGARFFVDARVSIEGQIPLSQAHSIASKIEDRITSLFPDSDVMIVTEPLASKEPLSLIRAVASQISEIRGVHGIVIKNMMKKLCISYHLELDHNVSVKAAHEVANRMEHQLRASLRDVSTIVSHLEPVAGVLDGSEEKPREISRLREQIVKVSEGFPSIGSTHEIQILAHEGKYSVTMHCAVDGAVTLEEAHGLATKMEEEIKRIDERIDEVVIHCEPVEDAFSDGDSSSDFLA